MKYFRKRNYSKYKGRKRLLVRLLSLMLSFFMFAEIMLSGLSGVLAADTLPANPEENVVEKAEDYTVFDEGGSDRTLEIYTSNVRYKDKDGKLQDIDNSIVRSDDESHAYEGEQAFLK